MRHQWGKYYGHLKSESIILIIINYRFQPSRHPLTSRERIPYNSLSVQCSPRVRFINLRSTLLQGQFLTDPKPTGYFVSKLKSKQMWIWHVLVQMRKVLVTSIRGISINK